jgi:alpha-tubulin suppressor-like RCC1 family protein
MNKNIISEHFFTLCSNENKLLNSNFKDIKLAFNNKISKISNWIIINNKQTCGIYRGHFLINNIRKDMHAAFILPNNLNTYIIQDKLNYFIKGFIYTFKINTIKRMMTANNIIYFNGNIKFQIYIMAGSTVVAVKESTIYGGSESVSYEVLSDSVFINSLISVKISANGSKDEVYFSDASFTVCPSIINSQDPLTRSLQSVTTRQIQPMTTSRIINPPMPTTIPIQPMTTSRIINPPVATTIPIQPMTTSRIINPPMPTTIPIQPMTTSRIINPPVATTIPIQPTETKSILSSTSASSINNMDVSICSTHTVIIDNGNMYAWGNNTYGQLGNNTTTSSLIPILIPKQNGYYWVNVSVFFNYTMAINSNGELYGWGNNTNGQLGTGNNTSYFSPQNVSNINGINKKWISVKTCNNLTIGLTTDGQIYAWGKVSSFPNYFSQTADLLNKTEIFTTNGPWSKISLGNIRILAINTNGDLHIINMTDRDHVLINKIDNLNWIHISSGYDHYMAINGNKELYAFGSNNMYGQIGIGNNIQQNTLTKVIVDGQSILWGKVECGYQHTIGLDINGNMYSWGRNMFGQLGNNTLININKPILIKNNIYDIFAGMNSTIAIDNNNLLYGCGKNDFGQLGTGSDIPSNYNNLTETSIKFNYIYPTKLAFIPKTKKSTSISEETSTSSEATSSEATSTQPTFISSRLFTTTQPITTSRIMGPPMITIPIQPIITSRPTFTSSSLLIQRSTPIITYNDINIEELKILYKDRGCWNDGGSEINRAISYSFENLFDTSGNDKTKWFEHAVRKAIEGNYDTFGFQDNFALFLGNYGSNNNMYKYDKFGKAEECGIHGGPWVNRVYSKIEPRQQFIQTSRPYINIIEPTTTRLMENPLMQITSRPMEQQLMQTTQAALQEAEQATLSVAEQATLSAAEQAVLQAALQGGLENAQIKYNYITTKPIQQQLMQTTQAALQAAEQTTLSAAEQATLSTAEQATLSAAEQATLSAAEQATLSAALQGGLENAQIKYNYMTTQSLEESLMSRNNTSKSLEEPSATSNNTYLIGKNIRITRGNFSNNDHWLNISEIKVYDEFNNKIQLDSNNIIVYPMYNNDSTYGGIALIDNNYNTFAHTTDDNGAYIDINLGSDKKISKIEIVNREAYDYRIQGAIVQVKDSNNNITFVNTISGIKSTYIYNFN